MKLTNSLLRQATRAAQRHSELLAKVSVAFEDRYGLTYSDVDCDPLIDALDYGNSHAAPTVADCDREMELCGVTPNPNVEQSHG